MTDPILVFAGTPRRPPPLEIEHQPELIALLTDILRNRERAEWCRQLEALDVPYAPMYATTDEVHEDAQAQHLHLFIDAAHCEGGRWRSARSPVSFDGERALAVTAPPLLGDHDALLRSGASPWKRRTPE